MDPSISSAKFHLARHQIMIEIFGASFVHDTGLTAASTYIDDPTISPEENRLAHVHDTVIKLIALAQHWEKLLFFSGGTINLQKSY
jgi:hypothetical protein